MKHFFFFQNWPSWINFSTSGNSLWMKILMASFGVLTIKFCPRLYSVSSRPYWIPKNTFLIDSFVWHIQCSSCFVTRRPEFKTSLWQRLLKHFVQLKPHKCNILTIRYEELGRLKQARLFSFTFWYSYICVWAIYDQLWILKHFKPSTKDILELEY